MSLGVFLNDCVALRQDEAAAGGETRYHDSFRRFLLRTVSNQHMVRGEGSYDQRRPDFRIYTLQDGETRDSPPNEEGLLGFVEAKGHSENLINLMRNDPRNQLSSYLDICDNVLITNYWEYRLIQRDEDGNISTLENGHYAITQNENEFWGLSNQSDEYIAAAFTNFQNWFSTRILTLETGLDYSRPSLIRSIMGCYRMIYDSLLSPQGSPEAQQIKQTILQISRRGLGHEDNDFGNSAAAMYIGQTIPMCMLLCRRIYGNNLLTRGGEFLRGTLSRRIYSNVLEYRNDLCLGYPLQRLDTLLSNCAFLVSDGEDDDENRVNFEQIESLFLDFMEFGEDEFGSEELGLRVTPIQIVDYMVAKAHRTLSNHGGDFVNGILSDDQRRGREHRKAFVLDPCCGTGRFYIRILDFIYTQNLVAAGEQVARARLLSAIGTPDRGTKKPAVLGRVIGIDIQPACVLLTRLRLEIYLDELGITDPVEPRIFVTDTLVNWPGLTSDENLFEGSTNPTFFQSNMLKRNPIHSIIGNPPWSADSAAGDYQQLENLRLLTQTWWDRYTGLKGERNERPANRIDDPYLAFFRIAINKSNHNNDYPLVTSLVVPDSAYNGQMYVGMREELIENYSVDFDLLGGQQRRNWEAWQSGKVFPVDSGSCIVTFWNLEERVTRFRPLNPNTPTNKLSQLNENATNLVAIIYIQSQAHLDTWLDVTGRSLEAYPYIPINRISYPGIFTNGCSETRNLAYFHTDRAALIDRVRPFLHANFETAQENASQYRLWDFNEEGENEIGVWGDYYPRVVHQDVINSGGFDEDNLHETTYRPMLNIFCYADYAISNFWDRIRARAFIWGDTNGMITLPGIATRFSHMPGFFHLGIPGNQNLGMVKSKSFPLLFDFSETEINRLDADGLQNLANLFNIETDDEVARAALSRIVTQNVSSLTQHPNLSIDFLTWFIGDGVEDLTLEQLRNHARFVWYHVLSILSSTTMSTLPISQNGLGARIPFPTSGHQGPEFQNSSRLGQFIAELQSSSQISDPQFRGFFESVRAWLGFINVEFEDGSDFPVQLRGWGSISRSGRVTPRSNTETQDEGSIISLIDENYDLEQIDQLCQNLGVAGVDELTGILGEDLVTINLNDNARIRNIPECVMNFTVAGHAVVQNWLAWRDFNLIGRTCTIDDFQEFRNLLVNLTCLILLGPRIEDNFNNIFEDALIWNEEE